MVQTICLKSSFKWDLCVEILIFWFPVERMVMFLSVHVRPQNIAA